MSVGAKRLLGFFVIFLAGSAIGFLVGGFTGSNFGMALVVNSALNKDVDDINIQLQALRDLRRGATEDGIERLERLVDDTLVIFDPAQPYPGIKDETVDAIDAAIENAFEYRREYPRRSDRPDVDTMVKNLFEKHGFTP